MSLLSTTAIEVNGRKYTLHRVSYKGAAVTFVTDQSAVSAVCVDPASGPTCSLATGSVGLITVTVAAGGETNSGNWVLIMCAHGGSIPSGNKA
jgi:hypothetical protein